MRDGRHARLAVFGILLGLGALLGVPAPADAAGEASFVGLPPCRLVDTRGNGFTDPFGPPALAASVPRDFPLAGQCGIPTAALAVSLNVTVTGTQGPGFVLLFPQGGAQPLVSTLNYLAGETVANAAIAPLGAGGGLTVVAGVSGTELILDVNGYFEDSLVHDVGTDNTFVGVGAGNLATTGLRNTALGANALPVVTGNRNTALGESALRVFSGGGQATAVGAGALGSLVAGCCNVAVGSDALGGVTAGAGNIAIGNSAGVFVTVGNNNIYIGHGGGDGGIGPENTTIRLGTSGTHTRAFVAGITSASLGALPPVVVNNDGQLGIVMSSSRFKEAIEPMGEASQGLLRLRPVRFRYRDAAPDAPPQYGLIAEEVAEVYPELVHAGPDGRPLTVLYQALPALLLNELQRQERRLVDKDRQLAELTAAVAELAAQIARLNGRERVAVDR
jgi:endosialidase-like protein